MGETNRWAAFSDEELRSLHAGDDPMLDAELRLEFQERRTKKAYQGPGLYMADGRHLEVLGTIGSPAVMGPQCQVVMRNEGDRTGILMAECLHEFTQVNRKRRLFRYLGPLGEETATVTLLESGPDWALLETGNGERYRLYRRDWLKVSRAGS